MRVKIAVVCLIVVAFLLILNAESQKSETSVADELIKVLTTLKRDHTSLNKSLRELKDANILLNTRLKLIESRLKIIEASGMPILNMNVQILAMLKDIQTEMGIEKDYNKMWKEAEQKATEK